MAKATNSPITNRRCLLAGTTAALSGAAVVNLTAMVTTKAAGAPDPIFALIARYRATEQEVLAMGRNEPPAHDYAAIEVFEERFGEAVDLLNLAADELVETKPTTMAGLRAFAAFVTATPDLRMQPWLLTALQTMASSVIEIGAEVA